MKEAAGEANMTVITIILIGIIAAIAIPLINSLMAQTQEKSCCNNVGGRWANGACDFTNTYAGAQGEYNTCVAGQ